MDKEELSREEIESLLGGASSAPKPGPAARAGRSITPGRLSRRETVGKEQMHALRTLHEGIGCHLAAGLSAMLRTPIEVRLAGVERRTFGQFISSLEDPACLHVLKAAPLEGNLVLDVAPSILYPIIARLLGGDPEPPAAAPRPLTEIELRLASRITGLLLDELRNAWQKVVDLEWEVVRVESSPQRLGILPPGKDVVLVCFELTMGPLHGRVRLCIPCSMIEQLGGRLLSGANRQATSRGIGKIGQALQKSLVELRVELARTQITAGELIDLGIGDVITTDQKVGDPLVIDVDGRVQFHAQPGNHEGQKAIRIEKRIEPS